MDNAHSFSFSTVRTRALALRERRDGLADTGDVVGERNGRRISPTGADEIDQICNIPIAQPPGESRHRELHRRLRGAWRLRASEHDRNQRNGVWSFDNRIAGQSWEHALVSHAVGTMAGGAVIKVEESSGLARIAMLQCLVFRFVVGEGIWWLSPRLAECLEISRRRGSVLAAYILRAVDDDVGHRAEDDAAW